MVNLEETLKSIALRYPPEMIGEQLLSVPRIAFNINTVLSRKGSDITICDIGGGIGLFSIGCAAVGMESILVDDFRDDIALRYRRSILHDIHRRYGVEVVERDVIKQEICFPTESIDAVTVFESMEHWHASPKRLFASVMSILSPGGIFALSAPNCVNLRERIVVPFGIGKWSSMEDWYEQGVFRGHIREPDVEDLHYIARDMGLDDVRIFGRNWPGYYSKRALYRLLTRASDRILQLYPPVCATLYLVGRKKPDTRSDAEARVAVDERRA